MEFLEIEPGSPLFAGEIDLRDAIFRTPYGRASAATMWERDRTGRHFVAVKNVRVIGCVGFYPDGEGRAILRHIAIAEDFRRRGIASTLLKFAEEKIARDGVRLVSAAARVDALTFYEARGFRREGPVFDCNGIPNQRIEKGVGGVAARRSKIKR